MLDNVIYSNLWLPRRKFKVSLLGEMLVEASNSIRPRGDEVFFSHLILQRKLIPVPLYLQSCTGEEAKMV